MRYLFVTICAALAGGIRADEGSESRHNFSPGPGPLPKPVMQRAREEFLNFENTGAGILELTNLDAKGTSHPGRPATALQKMMTSTEKKLRAQLEIPDEYRVLFMHGGAVGQFSAMPLNLLDEGSFEGIDFVNTGFWSERAATEAKKYSDSVQFCAKTTPGGAVPPVGTWKVRKLAAYVHLTLSETVQGIEFLDDPASPFATVPLVADATSTLLSRPIDIRRYGAIYASGGKNLPAGVTVVIIREELLRTRKPHPMTPQVFDYRLQGGGLIASPPSIFHSAPNTPPIFGVYMLGLILDDIETRGGLSAVAKNAAERAARVYQAVDGSGGFYKNVIDPKSRSRMSAVFTIGDRDLEQRFLREAEEERGMHALFGHPVKGGIRVTLYNGVSDEAVHAVVTFMGEFKERFAAFLQGQRAQEL